MLKQLFFARTEILSAQQTQLWYMLDEIPDHFVLYGDTALRLRLAHRHSHVRSRDFEFRTSESFNPERLGHDVSFLHGAEVIEIATNRLIVAVGKDLPVVMRFQGAETSAQISPPDRAFDTGLAVASLEDLAGEKMFRISRGAKVDDARDIAALLQRGMTMDKILSYAKAQFGVQFDLFEAAWNL